MSGQWKTVLGGVLLMVAAVVMGIVGIWTGDDRWGYTAVLVGSLGFVVAFAAATFPGGDW